MLFLIFYTKKLYSLERYFSIQYILAVLIFGNILVETKFGVDEYTWP